MNQQIKPDINNKTDVDIGGFSAIYLAGLVLWIIMFPAFYFYRYHSQAYQLYHFWYFIPFGLGIFILCWNAWRWSSINLCGDYKTEVGIIEFAERNTSYLLIAISFISYFMGAKEYYFLLSLYFAVGGVLPLYWIPKNKVKNLMFLRHIKTIPYTYAICFFLMGIVSILQFSK